jgi:putative hemolysin
MNADPPYGISVAETAIQELRAGNLGVRVAATEDEIDAVQALRFRVFYQEMGAVPDAATAALSRDRDAYDAVADHLLVVDHTLGEGPGSVVGTYRLIRQSAASRIGRFYSADEYDLTPLMAFPGHILELGRSCVAAPYRNRAVMQLLWRGIAAYVFRYRIGLMFGCASLPGTDPDAMAEELTYLYVHHLAPVEVRPRALAGRFVEMRRMPPGAVDARRAATRLPPLIKGYLRLGGFVGDGAVIDRQFNTTDVAVVVKTDLVTDKYYRHYERDAFATGVQPPGLQPPGLQPTGHAPVSQTD